MEIFKFQRNSKSKKVMTISKNIFLLLIFILISTSIYSQINNSKRDTIVLDEVYVDAIDIFSKEKKELYPISELSFKDYQTLTPQVCL